MAPTVWNTWGWLSSGPRLDHERAAELGIATEREAAVRTAWINRCTTGNVWGPGDSAVVIRELDFDDGPAHLDLGIDLNAKNQEAPVLWDCTAGVGGTQEAAIKQAVEMWAITAGAAFMELLYQRGELADHIQHDDPEGLPGHHVIHGPVGVFAMNGDIGPLTEWFSDHPVVPRLGDALAGALDHPHLNGVKILCGGDRDTEMAEVRVNGEVHEQASAILRGLDWPRGAEFAYARTYLLVLPEHG